MKKIILFAGTTEGRELSERLCEANICHTVCVATAYGEIVMKEHPCCTIHMGRLSEEEMCQLFRKEGFSYVIDATHPYAEVVTTYIQNAVLKTGGTYVRLQRDLGMKKEDAAIHYVEDHRECIQELLKGHGNVLLTIGCKELYRYAKEEGLRERLYARVLPGLESISICMELGMQGKQIIAMQGPFTKELNEALIKQYNITAVVTKQSGQAGGYVEKVEAAKTMGIPIYVIGKPKKTTGDSFETVCKKIEAWSGKCILKKERMDIAIVGIGMGSEKLFTLEAKKAIAEADILCGAKRMMEHYEPVIEKKPFYLPKDVIPYLEEVQERMTRPYRVALLMSGDCGFYSGATKLFHAIQKEIEEERLLGTVRMVPGISSISYLAARIGESYDDGQILSMHGKKLYHFIRKIETSSKTFLLVSGVEDVREVGQQLIDAGLTHCEVCVAYQLSYENEEITVCTPKECLSYGKEGLYTLCIRNAHPKVQSVTHGMEDGLFLREKVPMTKEEVREAIISKLHLYEGAVVCDIGSGTGSIAVEMGALSSDIKVYAIEKEKDACQLILKNASKFHVDNVEVLEGMAPEKLDDLPFLTHAFIGGSSGRLQEIMQVLYKNNPSMRVVVSAVTMETFCEMEACMKKEWIGQSNCVQIQVSKTMQAGAYHLMRAENPVWIGTFVFDGGVYLENEN